MRSGSAAASASSSSVYSDEPPWTDAVTSRWMSRDDADARSWTLRVMTGMPSTSGGKSHSWVTPTSSSRRPMAHTISVAEGRSETMRIAESGRRSARPADRGRGQRGFSSSTAARAAALSVNHVASMAV